MNLTALLVDENGNTSPRMRVIRGETRGIWLYLRLPSDAPYTLPYNATNITVTLKGTPNLVKNFSSGVAFLGAYSGIYFALSAAETAAMPLGQIDGELCCDGPGFTWMVDMPFCLNTVDPIVK